MWKKLKINDLCLKTKKIRGIKTNEYSSSGSFPIVDQGNKFISGYTDKIDSLYNDSLPVIIFGDHTLAVKYVDFLFCVGADGTQILKPNEEIVIGKFLYYSILKLNIKSLGYSRHFKVLKEAIFDIPPIEKQERIVAILDQADFIRQKRKQAIVLLDNYIKAVFFDLFGDPMLNPHRYKNEMLRSLIDNIQAGWSAQGENRRAAENEFGVLKISAVTSGFFRPSENKYVSDIKGRVLIKLEKGDLLFSRANTRELVAATCVVDSSYDNLFLPDKLWKISPKKNIVNSLFLHFLISYDHFRDILRGKATGTSGSMLNISQKKFLDTICYVPPIELQNKFAKIISETELIKQKMLSQSDELDNQFQALMQKAFKGELSFSSHG